LGERFDKLGTASQRVGQLPDVAWGHGRCAHERLLRNGANLTIRERQREKPFLTRALRDVEERLVGQIEERHCLGRGRGGSRY
jgi:hypothetical protein